MTGIVGWVLEHPTLLLLLGCALVVAVAGFAVEDITLPRLVDASRGSWRRAIVVMMTFHAGLLLGWGLMIVMVLAIERSTGSRMDGLWVTVPAVLLLTPWSLYMVPSTGVDLGEDFRDHGADLDVSRALAATALPFATLEVAIAILAAVRPLL